MNWSLVLRAIAGKSWPLLAAFCLMLEGCSSQQLDHTGQAWRKSLCADYIGGERSRCEAEADRR